MAPPWDSKAVLGCSGRAEALSGCGAAPAVGARRSSVDIREIKEIRPGKNSRDFDRYQEDPCFRPDHSHCFVVLYGTEFRLKTLSLQATSEDEVNMWIKGLNWLVADTLRAPTPLQIERWLRKQFYSLDRNREDSLKILPSCLCKVSSTLTR